MLEPGFMWLVLPIPGCCSGGMVSIGPVKGCVRAISIHLYRFRQNTGHILWYVVRSNSLRGGLAESNRTFKSF